MPKSHSGGKQQVSMLECWCVERPEQSRKQLLLYWVLPQVQSDFALIDASRISSAGHL